MASIGTSSNMQKKMRQTRAQLQDTVQQLKALAVSFMKAVTLIPLQSDFPRTKRCRSAAQEYKGCSHEVLHAGVRFTSYLSWSWWKHNTQQHNQATCHFSMPMPHIIAYMLNMDLQVDWTSAMLCFVVSRMLQDYVRCNTASIPQISPFIL